MPAKATFPESVTDKLDASLWQLLTEGGLDQGDAMSVVVRCTGGCVDEVAHVVYHLGGRVQRKIPILDKIVAWLPPTRILDLAASDAVARLGQEEQYSVAS
jgi:hypothetical protein